MNVRPPPRPSLPIRMELGLAAFAPVVGLLAYRTRSIPWAALLLGVVSLAGLVLMVIGVCTISKGSKEPFQFARIEDLGSEVLGHVGAYLVPLLVDGRDSQEEVILGIVILAIIIQIHIATGKSLG